MNSVTVSSRGMGNRKEVRQKVREHVLGFFDQDHYGSDDPNATPEKNVHDQVAAMIYPGAPARKQAEAIVEGGTLLIYHVDVVDFINGLGLNPLHREYDVMTAWNKYINLCAREIMAIYEEMERAK